MVDQRIPTASHEPMVGLSNTPPNLPSQLKVTAEAPTQTCQGGVGMPASSRDSRGALKLLSTPLPPWFILIPPALSLMSPRHSRWQSGAHEWDWGEVLLSEVVWSDGKIRLQMKTGRRKDDTAAELQKGKIGAIHIARNEAMAHHETGKMEGGKARGEGMRSQGAQ